MEQDAEREEISQPGESDQDGSEWKEIPLSRARARRGIEGKFSRPVDDSGAGCGTAGINCAFLPNSQALESLLLRHVLDGCNLKVRFYR